MILSIQTVWIALLAGRVTLYLPIHVDSRRVAFYLLLVSCSVLLLAISRSPFLIKWSQAVKLRGRCHEEDCLQCRSATVGLDQQRILRQKLIMRELQCILRG